MKKILIILIIFGIVIGLGTSAYKIRVLEDDMEILVENGQYDKVQKQKSLIEREKIKAVFYVLRGDFFFLSIYVLVEFCKLISSKTVNAEEIESYGINVLGSLYQKYTSEELNNHKGWDRFLDRFENYELSNENVYETAAAKLKNQLTKRESLLIISSLEYDEVSSVVLKLQQCMRYNQLISTWSCNYENALSKLREQNNGKCFILLIEKTGTSVKTDVLALLKNVSNNDVELVGAFMI